MQNIIIMMCGITRTCRTVSNVFFNMLLCSQVLGGELILIMCLTRMTWCSMTSQVVSITPPQCRQVLTSEHCVSFCVTLWFIRLYLQYIVVSHGHFLSFWVDSSMPENSGMSKLCYNVHKLLYVCKHLYKFII